MQTSQRLALLRAPDYEVVFHRTLWDMKGLVGLEIREGYNGPTKAVTADTGHIKASEIGHNLWIVLLTNQGVSALRQAYLDLWRADPDVADVLAVDLLACRAIGVSPRPSLIRHHYSSVIEVFKACGEPAHEPCLDLKPLSDRCLRLLE